MFSLETVPGTPDQLERRLCDEDWCRSYFISARWPGGVTCARCNCDNIVLSEPNLTTCPHCGHAFSITSGTLLHGTKKNISLWLKAAWIVCSSIENLSIRNLQHKLKMKNYQTARDWMKKLQCAKRMADNRKCTGLVEIENCPLFLRKENRESHLFAALEIDVKNDVTGRLRMYQCSELSPVAVGRFLHYCVEHNSTVLFPDREPYVSFHSDQYLSITESPAFHRRGVSQFVAAFLASQLNHSSNVFSLRRLRTLLDEFCFQENKKLFPDTLAVFENLVASIVRNPPLSAGLSQAPPVKRWRC